MILAIIIIGAIINGVIIKNGVHYVLLVVVIMARLRSKLIKLIYDQKHHSCDHQVVFLYFYAGKLTPH